MSSKKLAPLAPPPSSEENAQTSNNNELTVISHEKNVSEKNKPLSKITNYFRSSHPATLYNDSKYLQAINDLYKLGFFNEKNMKLLIKFPVSDLRDKPSLRDICRYLNSYIVASNIRDSRSEHIISVIVLSILNDSNKTTHELLDYLYFFCRTSQKYPDIPFQPTDYMKYIDAGIKNELCMDLAKSYNRDENKKKNQELHKKHAEIDPYIIRITGFTFKQCNPLSESIPDAAALAKYAMSNVYLNKKCNVCNKEATEFTLKFSNQSYIKLCSMCKDHAGDKTESKPTYHIKLVNGQVDINHSLDLNNLDLNGDNIEMRIGIVVELINECKKNIYISDDDFNILNMYYRVCATDFITCLKSALSTYITYARTLHLTVCDINDVIHFGFHYSLITFAHDFAYANPGIRSKMYSYCDYLIGTFAPWHKVIKNSCIHAYSNSVNPEERNHIVQAIIDFNKYIETDLYKGDTNQLSNVLGPNVVTYILSQISVFVEFSRKCQNIKNESPDTVDIYSSVFDDTYYKFLIRTAFKIQCTFLFVFVNALKTQYQRD